MSTFSLTSKAQSNENVYLNRLAVLVHMAELDNDLLVQEDRTGTGTVSDFSITQKFHCDEGLLPLISRKKIFVRSMMAELLWFLEGSTNAWRLNELGSSIWDEWAGDDGELGPGTYGKQWMSWDDYTLSPDYDSGRLAQYGYDVVLDPNSDISNMDLLYHRSINQIENLIQGLIDNPFSRRHVVWAWNPGKADQTALPPCHMGFVCQVKKAAGGKKKINLHMTQRSQDYFLGAPFNFASYAALLHLLCQLTGYEPGTLAVTAVDQHLYLNHLDVAKLMLERRTQDDNCPQIKWDVEKGSGVGGFREMMERVKNENAHPYEITGYSHLNALPAPIAV